MLDRLAQRRAPADADRGRFLCLDQPPEKSGRAAPEYRMQQRRVGRRGNDHRVHELEALAQPGFQLDAFRQRRIEADPHHARFQRFREDLVDPPPGDVHPLSDLLLGEAFDMIEPCGPHHQITLLHKPHHQNIRCHIDVTYVT